MTMTGVRPCGGQEVHKTSENSDTSGSKGPGEYIVFSASAPVPDTVQEKLTSLAAHQTPVQASVSAPGLFVANLKAADVEQLRAAGLRVIPNTQHAAPDPADPAQKGIDGSPLAAALLALEKAHSEHGTDRDAPAVSSARNWDPLTAAAVEARLREGIFYVHIG